MIDVEPKPVTEADVLELERRKRAGELLDVFACEHTAPAARLSWLASGPHSLYAVKLQRRGDSLPTYYLCCRECCTVTLAQLSENPLN